MEERKLNVYTFKAVIIEVHDNIIAIDLGPTVMNLGISKDDAEFLTPGDIVTIKVELPDAQPRPTDCKPSRQTPSDR